MHTYKMPTNIKRSTFHRANGTYLRALLGLPLEDHRLSETTTLADDITIATARLVIVAAPTLSSLDTLTVRLQSAALQQGWKLLSADGLHRTIIERSDELSSTTGVPQ